MPSSFFMTMLQCSALATGSHLALGMIFIFCIFTLPCPAASEPTPQWGHLGPLLLLHRSCSSSMILPGHCWGPGFSPSLPWTANTPALWRADLCTWGEMWVLRHVQHPAKGKSLYIGHCLWPVIDLILASSTPSWRSQQLHITLNRRRWQVLHLTHKSPSSG